MAEKPRSHVAAGGIFIFVCVLIGVFLYAATSSNMQKSNDAQNIEIAADAKADAIEAEANRMDAQADAQIDQIATDIGAGSVNISTDETNIKADAMDAEANRLDAQADAEAAAVYSSVK